MQEEVQTPTTMSSLTTYTLVMQIMTRGPAGIVHCTDLSLTRCSA